MCACKSVVKNEFNKGVSYMSVVSLSSGILDVNDTDDNNNEVFN